MSTVRLVQISLYAVFSLLVIVVAWWGQTRGVSSPGAMFIVWLFQSLLPVGLGYLHGYNIRRTGSSRLSMELIWYIPVGAAAVAMLETVVNLIDTGEVSVRPLVWFQIAQAVLVSIFGTLWWVLETAEATVTWKRGQVERSGPSLERLVENAIPEPRRPRLTGSSREED